MDLISLDLDRISGEILKKVREEAGAEWDRFSLEDRELARRVASNAARLALDSMSGNAAAVESSRRDVYAQLSGFRAIAAKSAEDVFLRATAFVLELAARYVRP